MKRIPLPRLATAAACAFAAALFVSACDVSSADSVSAAATDASGTSYDYSGRYTTEDNDGNILSGATGGYGLSYLVLLQSGTSLNGRDSKGQHWEGSISSIASGGTASFSLSGSMNTGSSVQIVGKLSYDSGTGTMSASWIEPDNVGSVYATATVSTTTNTPSSSLSVSPTSATLATSASRTFTASGGTSPYTWTLSGSGTLNRSSGQTVVYRASTSEGTATLTVYDSADSSATADITVED